MFNQELDVTFGVELECILAFHESLLQEHLDRIGDASSIVKTITDEQRVELRTNGMTYIRTRPKYMGWGLTSECPFPADRQPPRFDPYVDCHRAFGFRPYSDEIVHVAQTLLPGPPDVQSLRKDGKRMDFSRWHLSEDASLLGVDKATMTASLGDRIGDNPDDWDSHGIELVSRILRPTAASFDEIAQHLALLRGTATSLHGALVTPFCGLHVHVGLPAPASAAPGDPLPTFDLPTLQHLAYMLAMYEPDINAMHAPHRRAGSLAADIDIVTNLDEFAEASLAEKRGPEEPIDWDAWSNSEPVAAAAAASTTPPFPSSAALDFDFPPTSSDSANTNIDTNPTDIWTDSSCSSSSSFDFDDDDDQISFAVARRLIFRSDMTTAALSTLLCGSSKRHVVNFTYLARLDGFPRTLEFRQHAGSLDPAAVRFWVLFVVGLVRCAHRMARVWGGKEGYGGEGYPRGQNGGGGGVRELWAFMGFEREGREFFEREMMGFEG